jgi:hypothetical protein
MTDQTTPPPTGQGLGERLTEDERAALWRAGDHHPDVCDCSPYMPESDDLDQEGCGQFYDTVHAVERILTAHRDAAEAERAALVERVALRIAADNLEAVCDERAPARDLIEREAARALIHVARAALAATTERTAP